MSTKYTNIGQSGGAIVGTTVADTEKKYSNTGSAVYGTGNNVTPADLGFSGDVTELWMRFDYYVHSTVNPIKIKLYFDNTSGSSFIGLDGSSSYYGINGSTTFIINNELYNKPINKVVFHISKTALQIYINDVIAFSKTDTNNGSKITGMYFRSELKVDSKTANNNMFSNVIIADYDCSNETLVNNTTSTATDETINADISRKVSAALVNAYDIVRFVKDNTITETINVDIFRKTNIDEIANYDMQNYSICDTELAVTTQRITSNCFTTTEDIVRNVVYGATLEADTKRSKYLVTVNNADTRISIPSIITDQSSGLQSVSIGMGQSQLSDSIRIVTINPVDINGAVIGNFLDYKLNMRAETTSQKGILQEITCMTDKDEILYKKIVYTGDADAKIYHGKEIYNEDVKNQSEILSYMKLSKHMQKIANVLGCNLVMCSDDYISTCSLNDSGATYQSIISELCGWTSKLPNMFINAFIRGNTLYVIQRGHEPRTINIDDLKMTMPVISRELLRTEWNNPQQSSSPSDSGSGGSEPNKDKDEGGGDYISEGQGARTEESKSTKYADDGGYTVTTTIRSFGEVSELHGAVMIKSETEKCIAYSAESESSTTIEDGVEVWRGPQRDITETKTKTVHSYGAHGWHTVETTVTVDGILRERRTSVSLGSTEGVTPFRERAARDVRTYAINSDDVNNYNSLVDTEFPVAGDYLNTCKNAIKWLNRKTQETVSMSIYDYEHVFDFCDRIQYGGNLYSIQSNNFEKNATVVNRQDLVLIRFY